MPTSLAADVSTGLADASRSAHMSPSPPPGPAGVLELSIIVPTFNESGNVPLLIEALDRALPGVQWEVIFVDDDSPDGTWKVVREAAQADRRVRGLQRIGRRGLSSACVEGFLASSAPCVAVIDGDMQHDERILPQMLAILRAEEDVDIVIGSRYVQSGSTGDWDASRVSMSRWATQMSQIVLRAQVLDPMSGFFMTRRAVIDRSVHRLSGIGFKLLLDLFASASTPLRFRELPYTFRPRMRGESKLDSAVAWDYLMLLADKKIGRFVPVRFVSFALIGMSGVAVDLAVFTIATMLFGASFIDGRIAAVLVAMTSNFTINNLLTYRDRRLRGRDLVTGLLSFMLACSVGALANVGISNYLHSGDVPTVLSILAGIAVGVVWNYAITAIYTWRKR